MLGHEFSSRIASNNTYFIIGKQPFLRLDEFHVHQNSGHTNAHWANEHHRQVVGGVPTLLNARAYTLCNNRQGKYEGINSLPAKLPWLNQE